MGHRQEDEGQRTGITQILSDGVNGGTVPSFTVYSEHKNAASFEAAFSYSRKLLHAGVSAVYGDHYTGNI